MDMKRSVIEQYKIERMSDKELRNEWDKILSFTEFQRGKEISGSRTVMRNGRKKWDIEIYISKLKVNMYPK